MNLQKLRDELIMDEGIRYKIYFDTKGKPTMGIGHLITPKDPEYVLLKDWTPKRVVRISKERVEELFKKDIESCLNDCRSVFDDFDKMLEELQLILANMMFNLGLTNFREFKQFILAVKTRNYISASQEMQYKDGKNPNKGVSDWYREVPVRAKRLIDRMRKLDKPVFINKVECENAAEEKNSQRIKKLG